MTTRVTPTSDGRGTVQVVATAERPRRQEEYMLAIRAGMADLVRAIVRNEQPEVTAEGGLRSLELALRAS